MATEPLRSAFVRRDRSGRAFTDRLPLSDWAERTGRVMEAICGDENTDLAALWSGETGDKLSSLFAELMESGDILDADGPQWIDIFAALVAGESIKPRSMRHPRIFIFGALEARLQSVDTVIIGGLNEGLWPGQTANNPFLSRTMKTAIRNGVSASSRMTLRWPTARDTFSTPGRSGRAPRLPSPHAGCKGCWPWAARILPKSLKNVVRHIVIGRV